MRYVSLQEDYDDLAAAIKIGRRAIIIKDVRTITGESIQETAEIVDLHYDKRAQTCSTSLMGMFQIALPSERQRILRDRQLRLFLPKLAAIEKAVSGIRTDIFDIICDEKA